MEGQPHQADLRPAPPRARLGRPELGHRPRRHRTGLRRPHRSTAVHRRTRHHVARPQERRQPATQKPARTITALLESAPQRERPPRPSAPCSCGIRRMIKVVSFGTPPPGAATPARMGSACRTAVVVFGPGANAFGRRTHVVDGCFVQRSAKQNTHTVAEARVSARSRSARSATHARAAERQVRSSRGVAPGREPLPE